MNFINYLFFAINVPSMHLLQYALIYCNMQNCTYYAAQQRKQTLQNYDIQLQMTGQGNPVVTNQAKYIYYSLRACRLMPPTISCRMPYEFVKQIPARPASMSLMFG